MCVWIWIGKIQSDAVQIGPETKENWKSKNNHNNKSERPLFLGCPREADLLAQLPRGSFIIFFCCILLYEWFIIAETGSISPIPIRRAGGSRRKGIFYSHLFRSSEFLWFHDWPRLEFNE